MFKIRNTRKQLWLIPAFTLFYFPLFYLLEHRTVTTIHLISSPIDSMIPFCEWFIIPYYLWFLYMAATVIWFAFGNTTPGEFHRCCFLFGTGMTIFLFISWVWPNGLQLRPEVFPRDNFLTDLVKGLYHTDTSTNVFPSIHVYNSVAACLMLWDCKSLKNNKWIRYGSLFLTIQIVLSTMFLKQHSFVDVLGGLTMVFILWCFYYRLWFRQNMSDPIFRKKERAL